MRYAVTAAAVGGRLVPDSGSGTATRSNPTRSSGGGAVIGGRSTEKDIRQHIRLVSGIEATRRVVRFADGAVGGFADTVLGRVKESTSIEWNRSSWVEVVVDEWIGVAVGGGCAR